MDSSCVVTDETILLNIALTLNLENGHGAAPTVRKERWEDIQRSWDLVTENNDGSLAGMVEGLLEAGKRKR